MTTVFIADTRAEERFALSLMMRGLHLEVVGEAPDWATTVAKAPASGTEMLLIDWDIIPRPSSAALDALRLLCPVSMAIVLLSRHEPRQQAVLSSGADAFISKLDTADRFTDFLLDAVATLRAEAAQAEPAPLVQLATPPERPDAPNLVWWYGAAGQSGEAGTISHGKAEENHP